MFKYNGNEVSTVTYNGQEVDRVVYNNIEVYVSGKSYRVQVKLKWTAVPISSSAAKVTVTLIGKETKWLDFPNDPDMYVTFKAKGGPEDPGTITDRTLRGDSLDVGFSDVVLVSDFEMSTSSLMQVFLYPHKVGTPYIRDSYFEWSIAGGTSGSGDFITKEVAVSYNSPFPNQV